MYPREAGFTLLELVVATIVVLIIAGMVIPFYGNTLASVRGENAVREFTALLIHLQERAIQQSCEFRLYFDPDTGIFHGKRVEPGEGDVQLTPLTTRMDREFSFPKHLTMVHHNAARDRDRQEAYIACYPTGSCDVVKIQFKNSRERGGLIFFETGGHLGEVTVE